MGRRGVVYRDGRLGACAATMSLSKSSAKKIVGNRKIRRCYWIWGDVHRDWTLLLHPEPEAIARQEMSLAKSERFGNLTMESNAQYKALSSQNIEGPHEANGETVDTVVAQFRRNLEQNTNHVSDFAPDYRAEKMQRTSRSLVDDLVL